MRPDEPSVIAAGAELVTRLGQLGRELAVKSDPLAGSESLFIGQIHSGEIFNQYPQECWLEGTRRWLPGADAAAVESEFRDLLDRFQSDWRVDLKLNYLLIRHAFQLDLTHPIVSAFQECYAADRGTQFPLGPKAVVAAG